MTDYPKDPLDVCDICGSRALEYINVGVVGCRDCKWVHTNVFIKMPRVPVPSDNLTK